MSHYLVELYSPNHLWKALSVEQREQFLKGIQAAMGQLSSIGVEMLALSKTDILIDKPSQHQFLGIWRFPDQQARNALLAGIKASGWYDYFDHINAACDEGSFTRHFSDLITG